jgi:hypothetical protein
MIFLSNSGTSSRRSAGVSLLVGVLAGVTIGGGVGVIAASSTKEVTLCANKKTNALSYSKNGRCSAAETKVVLNQTGDSGVAGAKGDSGVVGAKGDSGVAGAKGDTGLKGDAGGKGDTGLKGDTGVPGAKGDEGVGGTKGDAGVKGDTGAAGTSSPTGFTARSVCGTNGTTLCAVGLLGPGGGTIVYVDSTNEMPGYDYLEVAPTDASSGVAWSTSTAICGTAADTDCRTLFLSDAGTALDHVALGTGRAATAAIVARHNAGNVAKTDYAAGVADAYTTQTASDWFLPSKDELNEVCKYERNTGQTAGPTTACAGGTLRSSSFSSSYWSSSESVVDEAWYQSFNNNGFFDLLGYPRMKSYYKNGNDLLVRPVRGF